MRIFAYGSLVWNPGFSPVQARIAVLEGWSRRWCVMSTVHRGTAHLPGLVLGLVPGGRCTGILYDVDPCDSPAVSAYLERREMCEGGYYPALLPVVTAEGETEALAYVARPEACAKPCELETLGRILLAKGESGTNLDYARRTLSWIRQAAGFADVAECGLGEDALRAIVGNEPESAEAGQNAFR